MAKPICHDLYCGLGGWAEGFLSEGYECFGYDIEKHNYGTGTYPGTLILQDILTLHGAKLKDATVIVASPPCTEPSYRAMPWKRAKDLNAAGPPHNFIELFNACFRIQHEAIKAAGHHIPLIVENVKGAQPWVGQARWHFGSYYLWGDVPALMPITFKPKVNGQNWSRYRQTGEVSPYWGLQGIKQPASGRVWYDVGICTLSSNSNKRKAASAEIAKIPFPLAQWIARVFLQTEHTANV